MQDEAQGESPDGQALPAETEIPAESVTATDGDSQVEETPQEDTKPKGGFQRRIAELTHNWRESQRQVERLTALLETQVKPQPQAPRQEEARPKPEDYGFDDSKYQAALVEYAERKAEAKAAEIAEKRISEWMQKQTVEKREESYRSREADFARSVEDYEEVVYSPNLAINANMAEDIRESDVGPQLAYYLGKNPEIARQLAALPARAASRELGKIEARLTATKPAPSPVSKAPPPPPKVKAEDPEIERDPDKMSMDDWLKWRNKQVNKSAPPWARK